MAPCPTGFPLRRTMEFVRQPAMRSGTSFVLVGRSKMKNQAKEEAHHLSILGHGPPRPPPSFWLCLRSFLGARNVPLPRTCEAP